MALERAVGDKSDDAENTEGLACDGANAVDGGVKLGARGSVRLFEF